MAGSQVLEVVKDYYKRLTPSDALLMVKKLR